jgi:hypothetical protein
MATTRSGSAKSGPGAREVKNPVGKYEERPYADAITKEHREFLASRGIKVTKKTESEQEASTP